MAAEAGGADREFRSDARDFLTAVLDAYRYMGMPVRRYLLVVLGPTSAFAVITTLAVLFTDVTVVIGGPLVALALFGLVVGLVYPKVVQDAREKEIRQRFHLFLTHVTVLSMTNIDRVEVFRTLADQDEYGALADEMGHLVGLVDTWNQSLEDACQLRSKRVSSELLSDFLERLAYTLGGGQSMSEFLVDEQDSIIQQFVIRYEGDLDKLEVLKELYLSLMLSTAFILVFAIVLPMLVGIDPIVAIGSVVGLYTVVQMLFVFLVHQIAPADPLWYIAEELGESPANRVIRPLVVGVVATLVLMGVVLAILRGATPVNPDRLPLVIWAAIPVTPLIYPGAIMAYEERRVRTRDREFPSFIRALGGVESVKQTSTANVLASLRRKDFGALTENIDSLYKRLHMRIDEQESWQFFASETGSYLIQKFGDMYVVGRRMGGDPRELGGLISTNINEVLNVREKRQQSKTTLQGVVYGLTAASAFAFFAGLEIVQLLMEISEDLGLEGTQMEFLLSPGVYDVELIRFLLLVVILVNALFSSLMIRISDRGHYVSAMVHFALLVWVGAITAAVTQYVVDKLVVV